MKSRIVRRTLAAGCLVACVVGLAPTGARVSAADLDVWAITGVRIVPVSGPTIERGTIVVRGGLIERVGPSVAPPADARMMDGTGLTVYPGLIDAFAFVEEEKDPAARPGPPRLPERDKPEGFSPSRMAIDLLRADGRADAARSAGITAQLVVPKGGIFRGHSALVATAGRTVGAMAMKAPVALHIAFEPQGGFGPYPSSIMGTFAVVRQKLIDAGHHRQAWERYERSPRGVRRPQPDLALDAIAPVLARKIPVVLEANGSTEVLRAARLVDEFKLNGVIAGGVEAWKVAGDLKAMNLPVLLSLNFPERSADVDPDSRETLRAIRARVDAPGVAAKLHGAGVRFAFQSGGLKTPSKYRENAIRAVQAGLPRTAALAAMTLVPAQILGVDRQLGSIEEGKIAHLLVTDGDLFDEKTKLRYVFVDGERFEIKTEAAAKPGELPTVDVTGTWTLTVATPEGPQQVTLALTQRGPEMAGTLTHPVLGSAEVRSGVVSGKRVSFAVSLAVGGSQIEATFNGTVEGNTMSGTVTIAGQGSVEFSGTRPPTR